MPSQHSFASDISSVCIGYLLFVVRSSWERLKVGHSGCALQEEKPDKCVSDSRTEGFVEKR